MVAVLLSKHGVGKKKSDKMQRFDPGLKKYKRVKIFFLLLGIVDIGAEIFFFIHEFGLPPKLNDIPVIQITMTCISLALALAQSLLAYCYIKWYMIHDTKQTIWLPNYYM